MDTFQSPTLQRVLLHTCCGPCSLMPVLRLREEGFAVTAFFFNPNIHPQAEYDERRQAMQAAAKQLALPVIWEQDYGFEARVEPKHWVDALGNKTAFGQRCRFCYQARLQVTASIAAQKGFDAYTTSLFYSRYQNHEAIAQEGHIAADLTGTRFLVRDFRPWWQEGIEMSKKFGLYRQKWCGCLLSKAEAEEQRAVRKKKKATD